MSKVFISRTDGNIPWGFRLQGGLEFNEPLILTNIQPNSPADGKIDPGDMLIEIAGTNVTQMTHKDVLELIQQCGNALFMNLYKVGHGYQSNPSNIRRYSEQPVSYNYHQSTISSSSLPTSNIPQAPIFDAELIDRTTTFLRNQQPITDIHSSYEQTTDFSNLPAVLAKSLGRSGGPKPFTYTPGGLDLSKILDSARNRRQRQSRSHSQDTQDINQIMSRRLVVPSDQLNHHHYTSINPIQPFSYARQQPIPPKKHIQHDTDVVTQSRAFQMLEGWISDSEKTVAALRQSPPPPQSSSLSNHSAVSRAIHDEENNINRRSSSSGVSSFPSRSFHYLQDQYSSDPTSTTTTIEETVISSSNTGLRRGSDAHTPSRSFKFLQDQYPIAVNRSQPINNREDLIEIYNKPPPSSRAREPEAPRFTGSSVPSRSFRFLQKMTEDDQKNDPTPVQGYTKPQQLLLNKYDEHNLSTNQNRFNEHPSRSFKYLQEMTGEHKSKDIGSSDF